MIISASRRTDIPAFYSSWLFNRLRAGYADVKNPYNPKQVSRVGLLPEEVDALVFWSKNPAPMLKRLKELDQAGYFYLFQYTLNAYPWQIEPALSDETSLVETFKKLSGLIGPKRVLWRYDPVLISSITDQDYHKRKFNRLAKSLKGHTLRVSISFTDFYKKVLKNFDMTEKETGLRFTDINDSIRMMKNLVREFSGIAAGNSMEIFTCAEKTDFSREGAAPGKCIDNALIAQVSGNRPKGGRDPGQRPHCGCFQSRDIGAYDTCPHGCIYCYANTSVQRARMNLKNHSPLDVCLL